MNNFYHRSMIELDNIFKRKSNDVTILHCKENSWCKNHRSKWNHGVNSWIILCSRDQDLCTYHVHRIGWRLRIRIDAQITFIEVGRIMGIPRIILSSKDQDRCTYHFRWLDGTIIPWSILFLGIRIGAANISFAGAV